MNVFNEIITSEASAEHQLIHWKYDTRGIYNWFKLLRGSSIHLQNCLWSQIDGPIKILNNLKFNPFTKTSNMLRVSRNFKLQRLLIQKLLNVTQSLETDCGQCMHWSLVFGEWIVRQHDRYSQQETNNEGGLSCLYQSHQVVKDGFKLPSCQLLCGDETFV